MRTSAASWGEIGGRPARLRCCTTRDCNGSKLLRLLSRDARVLDARALSARSAGGRSQRPPPPRAGTHCQMRTISARNASTSWLCSYGSAEKHRKNSTRPSDHTSLAGVCSCVYSPLSLTAAHRPSSRPSEWLTSHDQRSASAKPCVTQRLSAAEKKWGGYRRAARGRRSRACQCCRCGAVARRSW